MSEAGWYPDPSHPLRERYHDGIQWTGAWRPREMSQQARDLATPRRSWWSRVSERVQRWLDGP